jgi:hypothetical protein
MFCSTLRSNTAREIFSLSLIFAYSPKLSLNTVIFITAFIYHSIKKSTIVRFNFTVNSESDNLCSDSLRSKHSTTSSHKTADRFLLCVMRIYRTKKYVYQEHRNIHIEKCYLFLHCSHNRCVLCTFDADMWKKPFPCYARITASDDVEDGWRVKLVVGIRSNAG